MAMVVYFGEIHYKSTELYNVYDGSLSIRDLWNKAKQNINDNLTYEERINRIVDGEKAEEVVEYKWRIRNLEDDYFKGFLYKNAYVHYKEMDPKTGIPEPRKVKTNEAIEFFYDPIRELLAYNRTQRFGYKDGLKAFCCLLSAAFSRNNRYDLVEGVSYTRQYDMETLKDALEAERLARLEVIYSIPNPKPDFLTEIRKDPEKMIGAYKDANITTKNVTYYTDSPNGIRTSSGLIETEIEDISKIHSRLSAEEALKSGYVVISTTDVNGITRTSKDVTPLTMRVENEDLFEESSRNMILNIARENYEEE